MTAQSDYSTKEWEAIRRAPLAAAVVITLAHRRGPSDIDEVRLTAGRVISRSTATDVPDVVKRLVESVAPEAGNASLPLVTARDGMQARRVLVSAISTAISAVETRSPADVEAFKAWLASVAARVLQSWRSRGRNDLDSAPGSRDEASAIAHLALVLRRTCMTEVTPRPRPRVHSAARR